MLNFYLSMFEDIESKNKFENIYKKYKYLMIYIANKYVHNQEIAEDIVHDVFLKIISNFDTLRLDNEKEVSALVSVMTANHALNFIEKKKRCVILSDEEDNVDNYVCNRHRNFFENNVINTIHTHESIEIINSMNPKYSTPLKLHSLGYKYSEIAALLDISEATVKVRIFRAREMLFEKVGEKNE